MDRRAMRILLAIDGSEPARHAIELSSVEPSAGILEGQA